MKIPIHDEVDHPFHPDHKLRRECKGEAYVCDVCKEPGLYERYTCVESCDFHLHTYCAKPGLRCPPPFFRDCNFTFMETEEPNLSCNACRTEVKGFVYHCSCCGCNLHPCCANLKPELEGGGVKLVLKKEIPSKCHRCRMKKVSVASDCYKCARKPVSTWAYVSTCKKYSFHVSCLKEQLLENWMELGRMLANDGEACASSSEGKADGDGDGGALVKRTPMLGLDVGASQGAAGGKLKKLTKLLQIISIIIAAILGDPITICAGLAANLILH